MHHCSRVGKNCLCQWLRAQEIIPEREREREREGEKGSDRDRKTQGSREAEREILILMNHHFLVSTDALRITTSVPPNQASLWHPSTKPTPPYHHCAHTHTLMHTCIRGHIPSKRRLMVGKSAPL